MNYSKSKWVMPNPSIHPDRSRELLALFELTSNNNPSAVKGGGIRSQGPGCEAVVDYRDPLATPDLESSGFPEGQKRWRNIERIMV
jgi:hypothetical protein